MAILVSDNFKLNSKQFIDNRTSNSANGYTLEELRNWDLSNNNIPDGFEVWVGERKKWYTYSENNTYSDTTGYFRVRSGQDGSLPVYTSTAYEELEEDEKPTEYIEVENISSNVPSERVPTNITILYGMIEKLQKEVERLQNSFSYGVESCVEKETVPSRALYELEDVVEEEPLWTTQESELESMFLLEIGPETELQKVNPDDPIDTISGNSDYLVIKNNGAYLDMNTKLKVSGEIVPLSSVTNNKTFVFINTSNCNFKVDFAKYNSNDVYTIDINELVNRTSQFGGKSFATLISVNKQVTDPLTNELYGESYINISVQELIENNFLLNKYIDPSDTTELYSNQTNLSDNYYISAITFNNLSLSRLKVATKYQDFSDGIEATPSSDPTDENGDRIKYKAAHITIRSVAEFETLTYLTEHKLLANNELVYVEEKNALFIYSNGQKYQIGSSSSNKNNEDNNDNTMATYDLLKNLSEQNIISLSGATYDSTTSALTHVDNIELNKIASITFINENNEKTYTYNVDSNGNLKAHEESPSGHTFSQICKVSSITINYSATTSTPTRGFISKINKANSSTNAGDLSDRVRIGAFYCPTSAQTVWGCSHGFIELENTSSNDYYLDGCYLHYATIINNEQKIYHLGLSGKLPGYGTYLIRCKKYASENLPTTFIDVNTYDIEWYDDNKLIDLTYSGDRDSMSYAFALTYGLSGLTLTDELYDSTKNAFNDAIIDSLTISSKIAGTWQSGTTKYSQATTDNIFKKNSIYKNTFELDPAMQAFQSFNKIDSSRTRWQSTDDYQAISLDKEYIQFPHSNDVYPVSMFTPKASFEGKNVSTDKTKIDSEKPNMVTCSFGIDTYKTRCFNWISVGDYDEFVWIREKGKDEWGTCIQSYWENENASSETNDIKYERANFNDYFDSTSGKTYREIAYADSKYKNVFPGCNVYYKSHKCIVDITKNGNYVATNSPITFEYVVGRKNNVDNTPMEGHCSDVMEFTIYPNTYMPKIYQVTDQQGFHWIEYQVWAASAIKINEEIEKDLYSSETKTEIIAYDKVNGIDTSLLEDFAELINYEVGNGDSISNFVAINEDQIIYSGSSAYTLTMLDTTVTPVQVQPKYKVTYKAYSGIMPILINTGDMTQNGTRINEWLDYYNAGKPLFTHLEQMNVVGNNDLGNIDETILGTGDDNGKSNPHFYNIAYCYEMPRDIKYKPIYLAQNDSEPKYIPSLYYFETNNFRIYMINSEITKNTCESLYNSQGIDIYTGWPISGNDSNISYTVSSGNSHYVYDILYNWMNDTKKGIACCHEMPFTVVTERNLNNNAYFLNRSISIKDDYKKTEGLVGSHCNYLYYDPTNTYLENIPNRNKGTYWLSRLLEYKGIKYCLGGHKHTYSYTWPLREYYFYVSGNTVTNSLINGICPMEATLENDNICFYSGETGNDVGLNSGSTLGNSYNSYMNLTKQPIVSGDTYDILSSWTYSNQTFSAVTRDVKGDNYVTYFMLQATGFKLKSNKELPGNSQKFSQILPKTADSKPSQNQQYPMFAELILDEGKYSGTNLDLYLIAINNILEDKKFNPTDFSNEKIELLYFNNGNGNGPFFTVGTGNEENSNCWVTTKQPLKNYPEKA